MASICSRKLPCSWNLTITRVIGLASFGIQHAGARCESLRQQGSENGSGQHQDEHRIEHCFVQHSLTGRIEGVMGDKRRGECGSDLRQGQSPNRRSGCGCVAEGASHNRRGDPLSEDERADESRDQGEAAEDALRKGDRIDEESGRNKEARNEQGLAKEIQFRPSPRVPGPQR